METVPRARILAQAMLGDYRECCDAQGFELVSWAGTIPSNQVVVVRGRRKWIHLEEAKRRWSNQS